MIEILMKAAIWFGLKVVEAIPGKVVDGLLGLVGRTRNKTDRTSVAISPYPLDCGDRPVDLGFRRPSVTESFGGYFAGLLEDAYGYLRIDEQIDCPVTSGTAEMTPIARLLYELRKPTGPRLVIIAASGGMGKTTVTAKLVKCLYEQKDADFILGDSAKTEHVNAASGEVYKLDPRFRDVRSFYRRLYIQLGLPTPSQSMSPRKMAEEIKERLRDYRAVIVVDNLETVDDTQALLSHLEPLLERDVRAIVTTRQIEHTSKVNPMSMIVNLKPLTDVETAKLFLQWHITHYSPRRPKLIEAGKGLENKRHIKSLIKKTGGIPLIMQLVINDVEDKTWAYVERLPDILLSYKLLNYLYKQRWDDLAELGNVGETAQQLVLYIGAQQSRGKRVTFADLDRWSQKESRQGQITRALSELEDRFLILSRDTEKGNFFLFPSFIEFLQQANRA